MELVASKLVLRLTDGRDDTRIVGGGHTNIYPYYVSFVISSNPLSKYSPILLTRRLHVSHLDPSHADAAAGI